MSGENLAASRIVDSVTGYDEDASRLFLRYQEGGPVPLRRGNGFCYEDEMMRGVAEKLVVAILVTLKCRTIGRGTN